MMPNHGGRHIANGPAFVVQPPAHIHIVARCAITGVESPDRGKAFTPKGHVAARNVLGDLIGEKHAKWAAR
jgi:hypothetical protein